MLIKISQILHATTNLYVFLLLAALITSLFRETLLQSYVSLVSRRNVECFLQLILTVFLKLLGVLLAFVNSFDNLDVSVSSLLHCLFFLFDHSFLPVLSKILEKIIIRKFILPIVSHKVSSTQFAYVLRPGSGPTAASLLAYHKVLEFLDSSSGAVRILSIDFDFQGF